MLFMLKVETIGDAYMVVGGVPEVSLTHAQAVAAFAIGMVHRSQEVLSPASNKPLQVCMTKIGLSLLRFPSVFPFVSSACLLSLQAFFLFHSSLLC